MRLFKEKNEDFQKIKYLEKYNLLKIKNRSHFLTSILIFDYVIIKKLITTMKVAEVRQKYLDFMKSCGHIIIPSVSLIPENDNTTLFTAAGMQSMLPYILGKDVPKSKKIGNTQKCFRSQDIEEVGDSRHTTFFEMLGNWSFGDYFKKEQIAWLFEFLTNREIGLGLDKDKLYVTCYQGNTDFKIEKDEEVKKYWLENGITENHIYFYNDQKNWWSRAGVPANMPEGEPGGGDTEVFFDFDPDNQQQIHEQSEFKNEVCHPNCDCGRFVEIGNSVFIQYIKQDGKLVELSQKNVDFGGGLTRLTAAVNNDKDIFNLDIFDNAKNILENISNKKYLESREITKNFRIILDHLQATIFLIGDGAMPGNKDQGYFVRRLIRRAIVAGHKLNIKENWTKSLAEAFIETYKDDGEYLGNNLNLNRKNILNEIEKEENKFRRTLEKGLKEFEKINSEYISGAEAFNLLQTYGFPIELTLELAKEKNLKVNLEEFEKSKKEHAEKSRTASQGMFKGGLEDNSEITTALHTSCHLMLAGMRKVLGEAVHQAGSNINQERLRFDFTFNRKVEDEEIQKIENYVNQAIQSGFMVKIEEMPKEKARADGVVGAFWDKYPEIVKVYIMISENGEIYSKELCGGPHVKNSRDYLQGKTFKIIKQEAISQGVRRFKGVLQ